MSIEIRHVIEGDCDCGTPKYSWEHSNDHGHYWECELGRIPSFDINNPAPLTIDARDWVHQVYANGGTRQIGEKLHTITVVPVADEHGDVTENSEIRMFHRIEYRGRSWTWELIPAHWADPPTRNNNAHTPIYIGKWPD